MKPKVGDIVTMADGFDEGILGIVLEEEENHYYGRVMLTNGKIRMFGEQDVEIIVQCEQEI